MARTEIPALLLLPCRMKWWLENVSTVPFSILLLKCRSQSESKWTLPLNICGPTPFWNRWQSAKRAATLAIKIDGFPRLRTAWPLFSFFFFLFDIILNRIGWRYIVGNVQITEKMKPSSQLYVYQATEMERSLREILPISRYQEDNVSAPKEWNQDIIDYIDKCENQWEKWKTIKCLMKPKFENIHSQAANQ